MYMLYGVQLTIYIYIYIYIWVSLKMVCYRKLLVKAKGVPFNLHWGFFSSQVLKEFVQDDLAILEGLLQKTAPIHRCALTSILAPPIFPNLDEMASTDLIRPLLLPGERLNVPWALRILWSICKVFVDYISKNPWGTGTFSSFEFTLSLSFTPSCFLFPFSLLLSFFSSCRSSFVLSSFFLLFLSSFSLLFFSFLVLCLFLCVAVLVLATLILYKF